MGNNESVIPFYDMPSDTDSFALQIIKTDAIKVVNGGKIAVDIIRNCLRCYYAVKEEEYLITHCYKFKLNERPFGGGGIFNASNLSLTYKYIFCDIFSALFQAGWEPVVSSDLSREDSTSTVFFHKIPYKRRKCDYSQFACISPSDLDKLVIVNCCDDLARALIDHIRQSWHVQLCEFEKPNTHRIKLKGNPWQCINSEQSQTLLLGSTKTRLRIFD